VRIEPKCGEAVLPAGFMSLDYTPPLVWTAKKSKKNMIPLVALCVEAALPSCEFAMCLSGNTRTR